MHKHTHIRTHARTRTHTHIHTHTHTNTHTQTHTHTQKKKNTTKRIPCPNKISCNDHQNPPPPITTTCQTPTVRQVFVIRCIMALSTVRMLCELSFFPRDKYNRQAEIPCELGLSLDRQKVRQTGRQPNRQRVSPTDSKTQVFSCIVQA